MLAATRKEIVLDQLGENIEIAQSMGIQTELFSIFGLPGETVEDAKQTLQFVQSLKIPVESNSGSQQVQLYFGSVYEKAPEKHGFRPINEYRPPYLSIGDRFQTETMTREDLQKVRHIWTLANTQMERDVYYKQHTFDVLNFLLSNRADLEDNPTYFAYGALASAAIEEYDLLREFLQGYASLDSGAGADVGELLGAISFFRDYEGPVGPTDRVIFDSRSLLDGVPFLGISGKYWDVLLGVGHLLPSFEAGFHGARRGEKVRFGFTFPDDYDHEELRGREVQVEAVMRKVFKVVHVESLVDLEALQLRNHYGFTDLQHLEQHNDILYYLAIRDTPPEVLMKTPSHFIALVARLARLHKDDHIAKLVAPLHSQPNALKAVAEALTAFRRHTLALRYLDMLDPSDAATAVMKARCLLDLGHPQRALELLQAVPGENRVDVRETVLECFKALNMDADSILSLEATVLDLKVGRALEQEALAKGATSPVVHGAGPRNASDS